VLDWVCAWSRSPLLERADRFRCGAQAGERGSEMVGWGFWAWAWYRASRVKLVEDLSTHRARDQSVRLVTTTLFEDLVIMA